MPQFNIRFLLIILFAACTGFAWLVHCQQVAKLESMSLRALQRRSGFTIIKYDDQVDELGETVPGKKNHGDTILARFLGRKTFRRIGSVKLKSSEVNRASYALTNLESLKSLKYDHCPELSDIEVLKHLPGLRTLEFSYCGQLANVDVIQQLPNLKVLRFIGCNEIRSIDEADFASAIGLREFQFRFESLAPPEKITTLAGIDQLKNLETLKLQSCKLIGNQMPLQSFPKLKQLHLAGCDWVNDSSLRSLAEVEELKLNECTSLESVEHLKEATKLKSLEISGIPNLIRLTGISNATQLETLTISNCGLIADLRPLKNLDRVTKLDISSCDLILNLNGLQGMTGMEQLRIARCDSLVSIQHLEGMRNLEIVSFINCDKLTDLTPLHSMKHLSEISVLGCSNVSDEQIERLVSQLPNTIILSD